MGRFRLNGLVAAPYTPFDNQGDLHLCVVEKQAELLCANAVSAAFICGTTGEGMSLTVDERMRLAQRWVEANAGNRLNIIVHVGHNSQPDAIALAQHARKVGATAIAAMPPCFFKPANVEQLVDFMRPIAAAANGLPFYYYHIPSMSGVALSMVDLLQVGGEHIPHLRGIKFTHGNLAEYQRCQVFDDGEYDIAWGVDELLLGALAAGATGAVGSTYNYAAPLYHRMIAAFQSGDMRTAAECSSRAAEMITLLVKHGVIRTGKATMAMLGIDCGPTRSPIPPLLGEELATVRHLYERMGFFDWAVAPAATVHPKRAVADGRVPRLLLDGAP